MKKRICTLLILFAIFLVPILDIKADVVAPIKILLVPGHDNEVWGAQYGNTKEADMTLALATRIYNILKKDKRFEVYITRDSKGYTKEFSDYFMNHQADILAFKENAKKIMEDKIASGSFIQKENAPHHSVSVDVADKLYGFNKWANENKMDAVIHIHFNDYPRKSKWTIGKYKGFAVYIPEGQMANWKESGQLGADIFSQLHKKYITSTYKPESAGLVSDQKLIAIGANNTLDVSVRSILIEYGYIYEKKFRTSSPRLAAYKDMAERTVAGIKNYFFPTSP
jgi:N-acetylmuramoyl-L-alanine amidase